VLLSITVSEKLYVPAVVGVPAKAPVCVPGVGWVIVKPGGKAAVVSEKDTGCVPPVVTIGLL